MTGASWWARILVRSLAPRGEAEDVLGDLEESHGRRRRRHSAFAARGLTTLETLEMAVAIVCARITRFKTNKGNSIVNDYKLGFRMLLKYPGLTFAGGLALAIAIGIGAGWYDLSGDLFRPKLPLPDGDRTVEVEMRDSASSQRERRLLHDLAIWRRDARSIEYLSAYRTTERNLVLGNAAPEPVTVAEMTASAFSVVRVPPILGRPLLDADEQPGASPVALIGYDVWKRRFNARADVVGQAVHLDGTSTTVIGVMPEGFSFPVNHRLWVPLQQRPGGYAPLEGPGIRVFGLVAPGSTQAQANLEFKTISERVASASPQSHQHLRPRVLAYGGASPGDSSLAELAIRHLPILLVLIVACANVGTLIYARTATRDAEISVRYALGATRGRIVSQLFIEALVLASVAAVVGLTIAHAALKVGLTAYYSGQDAGVPFWVQPGLKFTTVIFAAVLTVIGAALLGVLPALKATGKSAQTQLKNLGAGGSTLRFGAVWTTVMIAQVALTVICIPPAFGISDEAWRDRVIRGTFPTQQYLTVRLDIDREAAAARGADGSAVVAARLAQTYGEFERRIAQEPDVKAITFADRLPGMGVAVRNAEVEASAGAPPRSVANMWTAAVGPKFFAAFEVPILAGRDFHDGDRAAGATTVLVNQNFARVYLDGANPVGRRVRFTSAGSRVESPWLEIVGMVGDIGMTPTDLGEAPYVYRAASLQATRPIVMGIRMTSDPNALAQRVRSIAAEVDPGLRLSEVRRLDDLAWREDIPQTVAASALAGVVSLGVFMSAAGIFSLMSVSVARRTKEIGLRSALGATPARLLGGIFSRAVILIGSGIIAGNSVILLVVFLDPEITLGFLSDALIKTSAVMLTVGLLACVEPARRALRIHPTDALKEA